MKRRYCKTIDLGLAVAAATRQPGQTFSQTQLSYFCGCHKGAIQVIEARALRTVERRLRKAMGMKEISPN